MIPQPAVTDAVASDGNRIAHRHKVFLPARMITPSGDLRVHLINVSATGALAHHEAPPAADTVVAIDLGGWTMGGRIVWIDGRRFGVAFSGRLDERRLEALLNGVTGQASLERRDSPF